MTVTFQMQYQRHDMRGGTNNPDFIKVKNFCFVKDNVKRRDDKPHMGKSICKSHI